MTGVVNSFVIPHYGFCNDPAPALQPCGLDTLWLSIPHTERFTHEFQAMRRRIPPARKGYEDFTVLNLPRGLKFFSWPKAPRILQFDRVGQMCSADIMDTLVAVVDCDPLNVRVHRADLTVEASRRQPMSLASCASMTSVARSNAK